MIRYPIAADGFGPAEIAAAISVLQSGRYTMGEHVREFEEQFAGYVGSKHAVMVNSGSSANLLMVDAMLARSGGYLNPGDGVIVPALAWSTTVAPLIQLGLTPIFADVDPENLEIIPPADAQGARAIMPVHVLGRACGMDGIMRYAGVRGLRVIEDACESFGSRPGGQHVGTFGAMGSHSFFFSHHLTTMEGGMITTESDVLADRLRALRAHGWVRDRSDAKLWSERHPWLDSRFLFSNIGYNVRPTEIQGAIGKCQLARADEIVEQRRALAMEVRVMLEGHPELEMIGVPNDPCRHSWMAIVLRAKHVSGPAMQRRLEVLGVDTRSVIAGNLLRQPAFQGYGNAEDYPGADRVATQCFMIGCHPAITREQMNVLHSALDSIRKEAA